MNLVPEEGLEPPRLADDGFKPAASAIPPLRHGSSQATRSCYGHRVPHAGHTPTVSLNRLAARATTHCLTGCAIGEVLGMVIGTALGWSDLATIVVAVVLAFIFGYSLTLWPLVSSGMALRAALRLALVADTVSITVMEVVDNGIMLAIPGAMDAHLDNALFWLSLAVSLAIAWVAAFPVNRWLISRGRGHAVVHSVHE